MQEAQLQFQKETNFVGDNYFIYLTQVHSELLWHSLIRHQGYGVRLVDVW